MKKGANETSGKASFEASGSDRFSLKGRVVVVRAPYYADVVEMLRRGVERAVEEYDGVSLGSADEDLVVEGALELPQALSFFVERGDDSLRAALKSGEAGVVALGCVVRGETAHFSLVSRQCYRGLQEVSLRCSVALGVGVLACDSLVQARVRADVAGEADTGGQALRACCRLMALKQGC